MSIKNDAGTLISVSSYIFNNAGNLADQLEQTLLRKFEEKEFPGKYTIEDDKVAGKLYHPIQVPVDKNYQTRIYHTSIGKYLYVRIYLYMPNTMSNNLLKVLDNNPNVVKDFISSKVDFERDATYSAIIAICEEAFSDLNLKRLNIGYRQGQVIDA